MTSLVAVLTVVVALLAVLVVGLLRSHAQILRRLHRLDGGDEGLDGDGERLDGGTGLVGFRMRPGLPTPPDASADRQEIGFADAADLAGVDPVGDPVALRVVGTDHPTLVAFLSSTCLTCQDFWESFSHPVGVTLPPGTRLVIVTKGPEEESPSAVADLAPATLPVVMSSRAWSEYRVPGSPYFAYVDGPSGRVRGEGTGATWHQVANLLAQATGDLTFTAGPAAARSAKPASDAARERAVDAQLMAAGIMPGDPSLYPEVMTHPDIDTGHPDIDTAGSQGDSGNEGTDASDPSEGGSR